MTKETTLLVFFFSLSLHFPLAAYHLKCTVIDVPYITVISVANHLILYVELFHNCAYFLYVYLFSGSGSVYVCVCVFVFVAACVRKAARSVSATFGLFSGRVCRNDAAPGFALLCNPPTSFKHHHSLL